MAVGVVGASESGGVIAEYPTRFRWLLSRAVFPVTMSAFIGLGIYAMRHGLRPEFVSPLLIPPFLLLITVLERLHPYCPEWNVPKGDLRSDLTHLLVSAIMTPQILIALMTLTLVPLGAWLALRIPGFSWPKSWPILLQLAFALVISEFGGYWAHRAQHTFPWLWRFHALHHGAARLYWLNAVRFHPIDMAMLVVGGFAPMLLLGCPPDATAITLLFANMHGTFQHANIHVKLGVLNWFFSMSELHRWHHSKEIHESNANYSGHVLIWDVVFGTRFLPKDRLPSADIGIADMPNFPTDYLTQLKSPFIMDQLTVHPAPGLVRANGEP